MPLERAVVARILERLRSAGAWPVVIHGNVYQRRGTPDIAVVYQGYAVWIEAKVPGRKATKVQEYTLAQIRLAGGWAAVISDARQLDDLITYGPPRVCRECLQYECDHHRPTS